MNIIYYFEIDKNGDIAERIEFVDNGYDFSCRRER